MKQTLYDILEVSRDASFEDIEVAYAKRFEKLKGETSWDSGRLVMLNEAREVLSDAAKRAAYDASLEAATQQPEVRIHSAEIEDAPRSSAGWIVAGVIVLAVAAWWVMRDSPPPAELTGTQPPEADQFETEQFEADQFELESEDETLILPEGDGVADALDEEILSEFEELSGLDEADFDEDPSAGTAPAAGRSAQIVGFWDCFDPVTGRTSEYGFAEDGSLTIRLPGGELQSVEYERAGGSISIFDANPPRTLGVEELAARRLVLSSGAGQRLVCSR
ncbi:MAG: J domain-containing protein [Betaproteobacteria bacterium]|nr:MAG: J domain-containing protein [Betaproteobacteria bacterium]